MTTYRNSGARRQTVVDQYEMLRGMIVAIPMALVCWLLIIAIARAI